MRIEAQRRAAAAAARLDRRAAAARAGALPAGRRQRARAHRGHLRPPRPAHAAAARARAARPVRARPARDHRPASRTSCSCSRGSSRSRRPRGGGGRDARARARRADSPPPRPRSTACARTARARPPRASTGRPFARGAGLMERKLISEADSRPLVVLDPRAPASPEALDAAVRAAASLAVHFAKRGGCALLLPGDRRAARRSSTTCSPGRSAHVRLALLDEHAGPALAAAQNRRGLIVYVAARPVDRAAARARPHARAAACSSSPARCPTAAPCSRSPAATATSAPAPGSAALMAAVSARHERRAATSARSAAPRPPCRSAEPDAGAPHAARAAAVGPAAAARLRARRHLRRAGRVRRRCTGWRCSSRPRPGAAWDALGRRRCSRWSGLLARRAPAGARALGGASAVVSARRRSLLAFLAGGVADELLRPAQLGRAGRRHPARHRRPARARACPTAASTSGSRLVIPLGGTVLVVARGADRVLAAARRAPASRSPR